MGNKKKLEELHQKSIQRVDDYVKKKGALKEESHEKLKQAKDEWQKAWAKLMDALIVLERIEI